MLRGTKDGQWNLATGKAGTEERIQIAEVHTTMTLLTSCCITIYFIFNYCVNNDSILKMQSEYSIVSA